MRNVVSASPCRACVRGIDRLAGEGARRDLRQHAGQRHAYRYQPTIEQRELAKRSIPRQIPVCVSARLGMRHRV